MEIGFLDVAIFAAGLGCGILLARVWGRYSLARPQSRKLSAARQNILTRLKETHDKEILHEAFRATEALRTELFNSLHGLRVSMNLMLAPMPPPMEKQPTADESLSKAPNAVNGDPNR